MPKKVGTTNWRKKRKQDNLEKKEFRYYIFCEGKQTEPNYFEGFKCLIESEPIYKDTILIEIEPCAADTMRVIRKAEDYVQKNKLQKGQIWCVYDKDSFPDSDFNGVEERSNNLNKQNPYIQYHSAWSNECIEIWFILHFVNYISNNHRTEYIKFLNKKFKELKIGKYEKNSPDIFDILLNHGNPKLAIRYAKRIILENKGRTSAMIAPGTKVYELVEELVKYLPEDIKKKFI
ncbi:MAG: RloB domain-containing protein [Lachnospiraceae bacterium]|nr:RloB domain-containing protein [Lachnospiraceae bacterium]